MSEWQPIETAPKDGTAIWIIVDGQPYIGYCEPPNWLRETERWVTKATFRRRSLGIDDLPDDVYLTVIRDPHPTHWMPLPAPPVQP